MLNWKKTFKFTLALLLVATSVFAVACDNSVPDNNGGSSNTESVNTDTDTETGDSTDSDTGSGNENDVCEHVWIASGFYEAPSCTNVGKRLYVCELNPEHTEMRDIGYQHEWGEWEFVTEPTCTKTGEKKRSCQICKDVTETATVAEKGHKLDGGICSVCGHGPVFPDAPANVTYTTLSPNLGTSPYPNDEGSGGPIDIGEGYYEITVGNGGVLWFIANASSNGQYALYSTNTPSGTVLKKYGSNTNFINEEGGTAARTLDDGNFYASVNFAEGYAPFEVFAIHAAAGKTVQFRFVRIEDAEKPVERVTEIVYPQQINGKAQDGGTNTKLVDVDVVNIPSYYFDETLGYYRLGTADNPGAIIYAAITKNATRIGEGFAFNSLLTLGRGYTFYYNTAVDGTRVYKDYAWFLCNYGGTGKLSETGRDFVPNPADKNALCYANYVNKDGVYPVTQELKEFLDIYVASNTPVSMQEQSKETVRQFGWLAACYYYQKVASGTKDSPYEIAPETLDVTTKELERVYYTLVANGTEECTYTLSITDENAFISFNGTSYTGTCEFDFTLTPGQNVTFFVEAVDYSSFTFTITITPKA